MSEEPSPKPPYVSYATFKNFLGSLKELVPARIDPTHPFMIGQSGSTRSYLMSTLRFFGLIDGKVPTPALKDLVKCDEEVRMDVWRGIFNPAYSPIIGDIDLTTATAGMIQEKFRAQDLTGETVNKCFSFFIAAAKDAGIPLAKHLEAGSRSSGGGRRGKRARQNGAAASTGGGPSTPTPPPPPQDMRQMLLAKFPEFDPSWPDDLKKKWFEGYERLLQSATPKSE